jgi:hypothetical protein
MRACSSLAIPLPGSRIRIGGLPNGFAGHSAAAARVDRARIAARPETGPKSGL